MCACSTLCRGSDCGLGKDLEGAAALVSLAFAFRDAFSFYKFSIVCDSIDFCVVSAASFFVPALPAIPLALCADFTMLMSRLGYSKREIGFAGLDL
jgi:hypothetical protein